MSKTKKILIFTSVLFILAMAFILFKLSTTGFNSNYIKEKLSLYILDLSNINTEITNVYVKLDSRSGLIFEIPHIKSIEKTTFNLQDTIVDINIYSLLLNGFVSSEINISSTVNIQNNNPISVELLSNNKNYIIKKIFSEDFYITNDVIIAKDEPTNFSANFLFTKNFIDINLAHYIKTTISNYNLNPSELFFEDNSFYKASINFDLKRSKINITQLENKQFIELKSSIDYLKNDRIVDLNAIISSKNLSQILKNVASGRETENRKILKTISELSKEDHNININFVINENLKPRDIKVEASGKLELSYKFDQNKDPSFLSGESQYDIVLYKKNIIDDDYKISSMIDLTDTFLYVRQINLTKKPKDTLNIIFDTQFNLKKNIEVNIKSSNSNMLKLEGKVELSEKNDFSIKDFFISNNKNVNIKINGSITNRNFSGKISGKKIDLSKNKIEINDNIKDYYFASEKYKIFTTEALLSDGLIVNNLKISIDKEKNQIDVKVSGDTNESSFTYTRKKNRELDISVAKADNIIKSVGLNHGSRNIIKNGKATISTYRLIGSLDTNVEVQLEDFVLINTPGTLKLLSLPSFSGVSSLINNETGIEFAYGKISYLVNEEKYSDINAYAVNDGVGIVLNGLIDRKKRSLDLKGQISPLHLISGFIQKIPIFGKLLVGNEGEGIVAVEYAMTGNQDDPDVTSNPLTIFKPRLFERTIDFFNNNLVN
ncbi:AsmA-like C-terminal domain-containing protein [Pelagibacteraceae bacterium]|nr:AsmA-like C-terminal domain-containing protein [Pelagibacteraceae bacterium]